MLFGSIKPLYFFAAFAVGLLAIYMMAPKPEVVVKFPSPYNAGQVTYKDKAQNCFQFSADKVECPADKSLIKSQPLQENFRGGGVRQLLQQR